MTKGTNSIRIRAPRFWKESGSVDGDHHARSLDDGVGLVTNLQAEVLGGIRRDRRNDFLAGRRFNGHFRGDGTFLDGDDLAFEAIAGGNSNGCISFWCV